MTQLSPHLSLEEMVRSTVADIRGIDNTPDALTIERMKDFAENLFEPVRVGWPGGELRVSSGYRCQLLNQAVGGEAASAHVFGCAADLIPMVGSPLDLWVWIAKSRLPFDQVIFEHNGTAVWAHLGGVRPGDVEPRRQILNWNGKTYHEIALGEL